MIKRTGFAIALISGISLASLATISNAEEVQALVVDNGTGLPHLVCHRGKLTLSFSQFKAAEMHIAHGDTEGACVPEQESAILE
jgi:hypothetical protein